MYEYSKLLLGPWGPKLTTLEVCRSEAKKSQRKRGARERVGGAI